MKKFLFIFCTTVLVFSFRSHATHLMGGSLTYEYLGNVGGFNQFHVTLKIYRYCDMTGGGTAALDASAKSGVFIQDNLIAGADNIHDDVSAISDNDLIEYNQRIVYEIYLRTAARGIYTFTAQEQADLLFVATQCPDAGGEAVIDARILYDRINPKMDYDDNIICTPYGYFRTVQNSNPSGVKQDIMVFSLYPNPASEKIRVSYSLSESAELSFCSAAGQQVFSVILKSGSRIEEISTALFNEGAYSWKLQTGNTTKNGKLFIIK